MYPYEVCAGEVILGAPIDGVLEVRIHLKTTIECSNIFRKYHMEPRRPKFIRGGDEVRRKKLEKYFISN